MTANYSCCGKWSSFRPADSKASGVLFEGFELSSEDLEAHIQFRSTCIIFLMAINLRPIKFL